MTSKTRSILLAAVLATPIAMFAKPAEAQYRVENGSALDANNQIGSGGFNGAHNLNINSGDAIVTGNVTAGREFRGNSPVTDPKAFRGTLAGTQSDRFISQSSSAYSNNAQNVRQFYGVSQGVAPPPGFMQVSPGSQAYIPAPAPARDAGDVRMGDIYKSDRVAFTAPTFGEITMPGPIDNSNTQSLLRASPLYGVVQDDQQPGLTDPIKPGMQNFRRRSNIPGMDDQQVQAARDELRGPAGTDNTDTNDPNAKKAKKGDDLNLGAKSVLGAPSESPTNSTLSDQPMNSTLNGQPFGGQIRSEGTQRNELIPPVEQSTQFAELHNRYAKARSAGPVTDQEANNQYNQQKALRDKEIAQQQKGGLPGGSSTISRPGGGGSRLTFPGNSGGIMGGGVTPAPAAKSDQPSDQATTPAPDVKVEPTQPQKEPSTAKPAANPEAPQLNADAFHPGEPLKVSSLTDGMKPGRVKDMLGAAEDQMRQGKYTGAIDQYDLAERVVPNNPLITLGRANAELGAGYYARAEDNIRKALNADNAMLMAQFDLNKFLGKDRVAFLEKDLKEVTTTEPTKGRAPFLLAYLKYHTGDKKMAANYLALSEKRLGKEDPLYRQMRLAWDLPKADPLPAEADK